MSRFGGRVAFWTLLVPLLVLASVLLLPLLFLFTLVRSIQYARFCWTHRGEVFLVCDTRHAWHDFISNNVACVLPASARLVWYNRRHRNGDWRRIAFVGRPGFPKPYLVCVRWPRTRFVSVNASLRALKRHTAKDARIQRQVKKILEQTLSALCG